MAEIEFQNYFFDDFYYKYNDNYVMNKKNELDVPLDFNAEVTLRKNDALIIMDVRLGDSSYETCPFTAKVRLVALFSYSYDPESPEDKEFVKNMLQTNGLAILYPYLRSMVSDITLKSNQFPPYVLPVCNFAEMMQKGERIKVNDLEAEED